VLLAAGESGCQGGSADDWKLQFSSLAVAVAEDELARLGQAQALASDAAWNWAQTLTHCAHSIEYAMASFR